MSATSIILIKMRQYIRAFRAAGATSPAAAINPEANDIRKSMIFYRLVRQGILVKTNDEFYYLDEVREAVVSKRRRIIAVVILLVLIAGLLIGLATL